MFRRNFEYHWSVLFGVIRTCRIAKMRLSLLRRLFAHETYRLSKSVQSFINPNRELVENSTSCGKASFPKFRWRWFAHVSGLWVREKFLPVHIFGWISTMDNEVRDSHPSHLIREVGYVPRNSWRRSEWKWLFSVGKLRANTTELQIKQIGTKAFTGR